MDSFCSMLLRLIGIVDLVLCIPLAALLFIFLPATGSGILGLLLLCVLVVVQGVTVFALFTTIAGISDMLRAQRTNTSVAQQPPPYPAYPYAQQ